jgi:hypothetical protein
MKARRAVRVTVKITLKPQRCLFARTFAQASDIIRLCQKRPYAAMAQISRQDDSRRLTPVSWSELDLRRLLEGLPVLAEIEELLLVETEARCEQRGRKLLDP